MKGLQVGRYTINVDTITAIKKYVHYEDGHSCHVLAIYFIGGNSIEFHEKSEEKVINAYRKIKNFIFDEMVIIWEENE